MRGGFLSKGVFEKGALFVYHEMTSTALQARLPCRIFYAQECELFWSCSQQFQQANDNGGLSIMVDHRQLMLLLNTNLHESER